MAHGLIRVLAAALLWTLFIICSFAKAAASASTQSSALVPQQCLESDVWIVGPGSVAQPQAPPAELRDILEQIDPNRIETIINKLVSFGTRHTLSSQTDPVRGIGAARDWLASEMRSLVSQAAKGTKATVEVQSFIQQPASAIPVATNISNVITTIQGVSDSNRVYLISGHYDSRVTNLSNSVDDAPGADDDGSGVAVVLELIRLLVQRPPPTATVMLVAVAGEEQGLYGSTFLAQSLLEAGADVQGMFTNDIVGSPKADNGFIDPNSIRLFAQGIPSSEDDEQVALRVSIGGENDSPARQLARFVSEVASNDVTNMTGAFRVRQIVYQLRASDMRVRNSARRVSRGSVSAWR